MKRIEFIKMVASGNDFVIIRQCQLSSISYQLSALAKKICDRKFGIGADGLLLLQESKKADIRMRIFNADGSQAEMCGNGARCIALWASAKRKAQSAKLKIETKAGIIQAEINKDNVKIKLTDPTDLKEVSLRIDGRKHKVYFINTGVPHVVIFGGDIDLMDIVRLGRQVRYNKVFAPKGTNVNFVNPFVSDFNINKDFIEVRTYERGVEDETLACGTGSVASALIASLELSVLSYGKINVKTKSGEILKVYFEKTGNNFKNVWLEGRAEIVYKGVYNV